MRYTVWLESVCLAGIDVDADSEDEAREKAIDLVDVCADWRPTELMFNSIDTEGDQKITLCQA